jgi:hypothetical protein
VDTTFAAPALVGGVYAITLQGAKVLAAGGFTAPTSRVLRLLGDGSWDSSFDPGTGPATSPPDAYLAMAPSAALAVQTDGTVFYGSTFNEFNGVPRFMVARLTSSSLNFLAASRKVHGASGPFDLNLPLVGTPAVEGRSGGANNEYQLVFKFGGDVSVSNAWVQSGNGYVQSYSGTGTDTITLNLYAVTSSQRISVTLAGVSDGSITTNVGVSMGVLPGDTTGNGAVTASDVAQTKAQSGQTVTGANFVNDVNVSGGSINASDLGLVKSRAGAQLP